MKILYILIISSSLFLTDCSSPLRKYYLRNVKCNTELLYHYFEKAKSKNISLKEVSHISQTIINDYNDHGFPFAKITIENNIRFDTLDILVNIKKGEHMIVNDIVSNDIGSINYVRHWKKDIIDKSYNQSSIEIVLYKIENISFVVSVESLVIFKKEKIFNIYIPIKSNFKSTLKGNLNYSVNNLTGNIQFHTNNLFKRSAYLIADYYSSRHIMNITINTILKNINYSDYGISSLIKYERRDTSEYLYDLNLSLMYQSSSSYSTGLGFGFISIGGMNNIFKKYIIYSQLLSIGYSNLRFYIYGYDNNRDYYLSINAFINSELLLNNILFRNENFTIYNYPNIEFVDIEKHNISGFWGIRSYKSHHLLENNFILMRNDISYLITKQFSVGVLFDCAYFGHFVYGIGPIFNLNNSNYTLSMSIATSSLSNIASSIISGAISYDF